MIVKSQSRRAFVPVDVPTSTLAYAMNLEPKPPTRAQRALLAQRKSDIKKRETERERMGGREKRSRKMWRPRNRRFLNSLTVQGAPRVEYGDENDNVNYCNVQVRVRAKPKANEK